MNIAVIDIGSNSVRMQISKVEKGIYEIIEEHKKMLRLGDDVFSLGYIKESSVDELINTLQEMKNLYMSKLVNKVRIIATASFREASNSSYVIEKIKNVTDLEVEIIDGEEEAYLGFLGVSANFELKNSRVLITDIGGGSAEFVVVEDGKIVFLQSTPYGCNKLMHKYFKHDPVQDEEVIKFKNDMEKELKFFPIDRRIEHIVCLGGTLNNISLIKNNLNNTKVKYVDRKFLKGFLRNVISKTINERKTIKNLEPKRSDIVLPAALFIDKILDMSEKNGFYTLSGGLRSGLTIDTINKIGIILDFQTRQHSLRVARIIEIGKKFNFEIKHSMQVNKIAQSIFEQLKILHKLGSREKNILEAAAILHDCGNYISYSKHHKHSYYLIKNSDFIGYSIEDVEIIANVARYHRKGLPKDVHDNFRSLSDKDKYIVKVLAGILRIADAMDRTHDKRVKSVKINFMGNNAVIFNFESKKDLLLEIKAFNRKKDLFEEVFKLKAVIG